jgi:hypothetical protein
MGDDDDDGDALTFDVDVGVNALKMSLDSLDTDFPRFETVLLIFAGVGVNDDFDSDVAVDNVFGMKDDILLLVC